MPERWIREELRSALWEALDRGQLDRARNAARFASRIIRNEARDILRRVRTHRGRHVRWTAEEFASLESDRDSTPEDLVYARELLAQARGTLNAQEQLILEVTLAMHPASSRDIALKANQITRTTISGGRVRQIKQAIRRKLGRLRERTV